MSIQKHRAVMRPNHPAVAVVGAFFEMRDSCQHYRGCKKNDASLQCTHKDASRMSNWCAMDCCPLLKERAAAESIGWD